MSTTPSLEPAPPRDSVWTKYSPNNEFPLASAASFVLHGLVVVAVLLFGLALQVRWHGDATTSPKLDVALVQAPEGDGLPPGGGSPPGVHGQQAERIEPTTPSKSVIDATPPPVLLDSFPSPQLQPSIDLPPIEIQPDLKSVFEKIDKDLKFSAEPKAKAVPKGQGAGGGQGGGGIGTGKGSGVGPGTGKGVGGTPGGGTAMRAAIFANRWRFDPTGSPRAHVQKLMAAGIIVGYQEASGQFYLIQDLKMRPVVAHPEPLDKYKDTVKWFSQDPRSVLAVSQELKMPRPPQHFVLLLPQDREQKFADAELKFANERNRDLQSVKATWFDFRAVGGSYEPVVMGQVPFEFPDVAGK